MKQPNKWTCGPTALAMLLGRDLEWVIYRIGHNGSEIVSLLLPEPMCRRGFLMSELIDVAYDDGIILADINLLDTKRDMYQGQEHEWVPEIDNDARLLKYMNEHSGLLLGRQSMAHGHMVYWNQPEQLIYDPNGSTYSLDDSTMVVEAFFIATKKEIK